MRLNHVNLAVVSHTAKESHRYTLNGVFVTPEGATVATNGYRLAYVSPVPAADGVTAEPLPRAAILGRESAATLAKGCSAKSAGVDLVLAGGAAGPGNGTYAVAVATPDALTPAPLLVDELAGQFPNYPVAIPEVRDSTVTVWLDPEYLVDAVKLLMTLSAGRSKWKGRVPVRLAIPAPDKRGQVDSIRLDASNGEQGVTVVITPMDPKAPTFGGSLAHTFGAPAAAAAAAASKP